VLPSLTLKPPGKYRDIRLGDVLVCAPEMASVGIIHYDLGSETEDGFFPNGRQAEIPAIIGSTIKNIQLIEKKPSKKGNIFATYIAAFQDKTEHSKFLYSGQKEDKFFASLENEGAYQY
jgi:hypothetical protein